MSEQPDSSLVDILNDLDFPEINNLAIAVAKDARTRERYVIELASISASLLVLDDRACELLEYIREVLYVQQTILSSMKVLHTYLAASFSSTSSERAMLIENAMAEASKLDLHVTAIGNLEASGDVQVSRRANKGLKFKED